MEVAHTGMEGDGIVAVIPVEKLYRIRTKSEITWKSFDDVRIKVLIATRR